MPSWSEEEVITDNDHELVKDLYQLWDKVNQSRMHETSHAQQIREEALDKFSFGLIDLRTRAQIERLFWSIAREVHIMSSKTKHIPDELKQISDAFR